MNAGVKAAINRGTPEVIGCLPTAFVARGSASILVRSPRPGGLGDSRLPIRASLAAVRRDIFPAPDDTDRQSRSARRTVPNHLPCPEIAWGGERQNLARAGQAGETPQRRVCENVNV